MLFHALMTALMEPELVEILSIFPRRVITPRSIDPIGSGKSTIGQMDSVRLA